MIAIHALLLTAFFTLCVFAYFWLRFGPKHCPDCAALVWGYSGIPVGIRMMHFHCRRCGKRFVGHKRLPL
jgi:hypothetical protein